MNECRFCNSPFLTPKKDVRIEQLFPNKNIVYIVCKNCFKTNVIK